MQASLTVLLFLSLMASLILLVWLLLTIKEQLNLKKEMQQAMKDFEKMKATATAEYAKIIKDVATRASNLGSSIVTVDAAGGAPVIVDLDKKTWIN